MKKVISMLLLAALVLGLTACGGDNQPGGGEGGSDAPIYLAVVGPYTGNNEQYGKIIKDSMQIALEEINEAGGVLGREVVLEYFDDKDDAVEAVNVASMIIDAQKYAMVIGNYASTAALPSTPLYQEAGLPYLGGCASHADLCKVGDYVYRTAVSQNTEGYFVAEALKREGYSSLAIFYQNNDYGLSSATNLEKAFGELGGEVKYVDSYVPDSTKDFTPVLSKIDEAGADVAFIISDYAATGQIIVQADQIDMQTDLLFCGLGGRAETMEIAGELANGIQFLSVFPWGYDGEALAAFSQKYKEVSGHDVQLHAFYYYNNLIVAAQAIEKAGSTDPEAIVNAFKTEAFEMPLLDETMSFNADRQFDYPWWCCEFDNGGFKYNFKLTYEDIRNNYESHNS